MGRKKPDWQKLADERHKRMKIEKPAVDAYYRAIEKAREIYERETAPARRRLAVRVAKADEKRKQRIAGIWAKRSAQKIEQP